MRFPGRAEDLCKARILVQLAAARTGHDDAKHADWGEAALAEPEEALQDSELRSLRLVEDVIHRRGARDVGEGERQGENLVVSASYGAICITLRLRSYSSSPDSSPAAVAQREKRAQRVTPSGALGRLCRKTLETQKISLTAVVNAVGRVAKVRGRQSTRHGIHGGLLRWHLRPVGGRTCMPTHDTDCGRATARKGLRAPRVSQTARACYPAAHQLRWRAILRHRPGSC